MVWECIAITLDEYNTFTASLQKSRDPNEKVLRKRVIEDVLPLLEKQEETRRRKAAQKEKELLNLEKLATAKRSSRIRDKAETQKQEEENREAERKKQMDLIMAKKEQEKWLKLEKERETRMITREQRLKEREVRRILHEEELANLSEDSKKVESGLGRLSERHLKAEIEKKKQALEELAEEEDWIFDCICGAYGQIDDGTHSIACDKCNIWQHSKCAGVSKADAERSDFNFVCTTCVRRAKDAERAKTQPPIKIKINRPGSSSSVAPPKENGTPTVFAPTSANGQFNGQSPQSLQSSPAKKCLPQLASWQTGPIQSPKFSTHPQQSSQLPSLGSPQLNGSVPKSTSPSISPHKNPFSSHPGNGNIVTPQQSFAHPTSAHAFSSPHPQSPTNLPPPPQNKAYTFVNGSPQYSQNNQAAEQPSNGAPIPWNSTPYNKADHPGSFNNAHRRSSITMPSPLGTTPALPPAHINRTPIPPPRKSSSPTLSFTGAIQPIASSPVPILSPKFQSDTQSSDPSQASTLPPSSTGISPVKQSPPRPATANSSFGAATPTALPAMTSLAPNAHVHNPTPPVKLFGLGQGVGQEPTS